jgi:hypothetical protein
VKRRPTFCKPVQIRLTQKYFDLIRNYADERDLNAADVIRRCVEEFFEKQTTPQ